MRRSDHQKLVEIEGLRAIAVLLVLAYHLDVSILSGGFVGVDVFFVVSGFLITRLLLVEATTEGAISLAGFWARRLRRIVPLASVVAVSTVLVGLLVLEPSDDRRLVQVGLGAVGFCANLVLHSLSGDYLSGVVNPSPLQHYWSLGVEEQFYLVWPVMVFGVVRSARHRWRGTLTLVVVLAMAASLWTSVVHARPGSTSGYYLPHVRAWEIMAGSLVALTIGRVGRVPSWSKAVVGWAGATMVIVASTTFDVETPFPGSAALWPVLGTVAVIIAADEPRGPLVFLRLRALQYLGVVSFALYLWHWPVIVFFEHLHGEPDWLGRGIIVAVSLMLAEVSRRLVENPVRWSVWLSSRPTRSIAVASVTVALLVSAGGVVLSRTPTPAAGVASFAPLTPLTTVVDPVERSSSTTGAIPEIATTTVPESVVPRPVRAYLLGDSTMAVLRWFEQGQVTLKGFEYTLDAEGCRRLYYQSCESRELRVPDEAVEIIPRIDVDRYDVIVVMVGYHSRPGSFEKELAAVGEKLATTGKPVVFVNYKESMTFPEAGSKGTRSVYTGFNETLARLVAEGRMGDVRIADWNRFTNLHPEWFRPDGIHTTIVGAVALGWFLSMTLAEMFDNPCPFDGEYPCVTPAMDDGTIDYLGRFGVEYTDTHCYEDRKERRRKCREDRRITATDL